MLEIIQVSYNHLCPTDPQACEAIFKAYSIIFWLNLCTEEVTQRTVTRPGPGSDAALSRGRGVFWKEKVGEACSWQLWHRILLTWHRLKCP